MSGGKKQIFEFEGFTLDPRARLLHHGDERVSLTPRAIDTLIELVAHGGDVVERRALLARVWPDVVVSPATLTQNVYTVRRELAARSDGREFVETVPRIGYRFAVPVTRVELPSDEAVHSEIRSLAVLPFASLTASEDARFVGLGLADALIARLGTIESLRVRPTSAILKYADAGFDPQEVAQALRVDAAIHGTVQQAGRKLRVVVQLIDPREETIRWSETFDADSGSPFELQDRISRRVAGELHAELSSGYAGETADPPELDPVAHQAYMRGRYYWTQRDARSLRHSISCFDRAIERDPAFARAYSGRADARAVQPMYDDVRPGDVFPEARRDAERALELGPTVAEAHASLAYVRMYHEWRWDDAEAGFRRAIALDPAYATAYHWLGFLLAARGRHDESVASLRYASELDPPALSILVDLGMGLYFAREYGRAVEVIGRARDVDERFAYARFGLAFVHAAAGRSAAAVDHARNAVELSGDSPAMLAALGHALALAGEAVEARSIVDRLAADSPRHASRTALIRSALGDVDAALADLQHAYDQKSRFVVFLDVWPAFDPLRSDPRFTSMLRAIG